MMHSAAGSRSSARYGNEVGSNPPSIGGSVASASTSSASTAADGARASSGSSRSSNYRRHNSGQQLSQIEKSVTHLLIATKQLLETLTQWSRHNSTESEVSDVYVRLGYEFNIACRAFNGIGVDTSDLGPVPELLRTILEETLSQEASPSSLDRYLPRIRDIIITLLHGLKRKQQKLRAKQSKDANQAVTSTTAPTEIGHGEPLRNNSGPEVDDQSRRSRRLPSHDQQQQVYQHRRQQSSNTFSDSGSAHGRAGSTDHAHAHQNSAEAKTSGAAQPSHWDASPTPFATTTTPDLPGTSSNATSFSSSSTIIPSNTLSDVDQDHPAYASSSLKHKPSLQTPPPPPTPPKQQDALAALQRGGDLERRASRRYSAYQISKHLGSSPNGMPWIPPAQTTPIPNRGREVRDSMNAVRTRGSGTHMAQPSPASSRGIDLSPTRSTNAIDTNKLPGVQQEMIQNGAERPETVQSRLPLSDKVDRHDTRARASGDPGESSGQDSNVITSAKSNRVESSPIPAPSRTTAQPLPEAHVIPQYVPDEVAQPGKELTIFLQYKSKIKKFILPEGSSDLTLARLQLAFIEKFAWNTQSNGNDLPEIYVQDPVSGVRHELEDLRDVKDRCVLALNVEALDEVKRHMDESFGGLRKLVEHLSQAIDQQQQSLQTISNHHMEAKREATRASVKSEMLSTAEKPESSGAPKLASESPSQTKSGPGPRVDEVAIPSTILEASGKSEDGEDEDEGGTAEADKSLDVQQLSTSSAINPASGRTYVNRGKKKLGSESERIVNLVDDLQDVVEDLRKDVVTRGVRPVPRQLEDVGKRVGSAMTELKKLQSFLRHEKPIWTKIWEKELELVCTDRDLLTMQEELATDLEDDLEKATQTFALVEEATKQQNMSMQAGPGGLSSSTSSSALSMHNPSSLTNGIQPRKASNTIIHVDRDIDPQKAKDGVLGEVRALRPNHDTRLMAISRAERARQRDLQDRAEGALTKEVAAFVRNGMLKKREDGAGGVGGVEAAERERQRKNEENLKLAWQSQQEGASARRKAKSVAAGTSGAAEAAGATGRDAPISDSHDDDNKNGQGGSVDSNGTAASQRHQIITTSNSSNEDSKAVSGPTHASSVTNATRKPSDGEYSDAPQYIRETTATA